VTLVFTDVQGSTALWEAVPEAMWLGLALHDALLRDRIDLYSGYEVKTEGDAFMVAFSRPQHALAWCCDVQQALMTLPWPDALLAQPQAGPADGFRGLRVRMGFHTGTPIVEPNPVTGRMDYFGPMVNLAARISGVAHGGQIIAEEEALTGLAHPTEHALSPVGTRSLKGVEAPVTLATVVPADLARRTFADESVPPLEQTPDVSGRGQSLTEALQDVVLGLIARAEARATRGATEECLADLELAEANARRHGGHRLRARALAHLAEMRRVSGDPDACRRALHEAEPLSRGDAYLHGKVLQELGNLALRQGDGAQAEPRLRQALELYDSVDYGAGVARASNNLASSLALQLRFDEVGPLYQRSARLHARLGDADRAASALFNHALLAIEVQSAEAGALLDDADDLLQERTTALAAKLRAKVVGARAALALEGNDPQRAVALCRASLTSLEHGMTPWSQAVARTQLGFALALAGQSAAAMEALGASIERLATLGEHRFRCFALCASHLVTGDSAHLEAAEAAASLSGDPTAAAAVELCRGPLDASQTAASSNLRVLTRLRRTLAG